MDGRERERESESESESESENEKYIEEKSGEGDPISGEVFIYFRFLVTKDGVFFFNFFFIFYY